jgi:phenylacetate-CoA ligase
MVYVQRERATSAALRELQLERLRETVSHAVENVPLYRDRLAESGLDPAAIESLDDVAELPFTTKEDFMAAYPDGLVAVGDDALRRVHISSGTSGKPKVVHYTEGDLATWQDICARSLYAAGLRPGETAQNAAGYGLFTGGLGWHAGVEGLGATVVPAGAGNTLRQIELVRDLGADCLITMPSYALYLAETVVEQGDDPSALPISSIPVGAEPSTREMRAEIADRFEAVVTENYGLSELFGPGVATECATATDGMHLWEDHFYPEIVDPDTGAVLEDGAEGELVLTSLTKEAVPVIRYRTGDLATLTREACECGRTHARIHLRGRADDLLIVRGVNVYPTEVESVVLEFEETVPQYRIDLRRRENLDRIAITVEHASTFEGDPDALAARLADRLESVLSLRPDDVEVVPHGTLERTEVGKVQRVYDHRDAGAR